jgi:tetratricopeptide (TPR) repeat protein
MKMKAKGMYGHLIYLLFVGVVLLLSVRATCAKTVTYTKEYTYQASEVDSKVSSRAIALELVKRLLLEELGTYLISETAVKDFELTKDRVSSLTAGVVMTVILEENWDGKSYFLKAKITADTDELVKSIDQVRKNHEQSKTWREMTERTEMALNQIAKLKKEMDIVKGEKAAQEKYAQAVKELTAMEWFKKGYALRYGQGLGLQYGDKKNQEALKAFDKAIEVDPNYARAYAGRASIYIGWADYQSALRESERAIELDPRLPWGFNCRGVAYTLLGNYEKAIADLNKAIELDPAYVWAYSNRSTTYYLLREYQQARADADRAIELDPRLAHAYWNRGRALASLNNIQDAIVNYDKAIELDPIFSFSFLFRAYAYLKLNNMGRAVEDFKEAARLGNDKARDYLKKNRIQW